VVAGFIYLPAEDEGITILRKVAEHAPGSEIAETALLRIGEYRFDNREFAESAEAYDNYLQLFPKSVRAPYAMVQAAKAMYASFRGVAYDEMPLIESEQRYRILLDQYPAAAKKARAAEILKEINELRAQRTYETAKFYNRVSRPEAAKYYYRQVADQYSASRWAGQARASLGSSYKPPTTAPAGRPTTAPSIKVEPRGEPEIAPSPKVEPKPKPAPAAVPVLTVEPKPAPVVATQPKVAPAPAVTPAPVPAPTPKVEPAPGPTSKPAPKAAPGATSIPAPVDLEKLAEPKPKGGK
jgi:outer membrane assembly lipoprotein YfiO